MGNKIKNSILIFVFTVVWLPFLQQLNLIKSGPLNGLFTVAANTDFTWKKWWGGSYREEKSKYLNDNVGLRPDLIRVNNQVDYSLFDKVHSEWRVLAGRNHNLYQDVYIYAYNGKDYEGYDTILERMKKVKAIQDTMAHLGKSLIIVHSPCKAYYYPDDFPASLRNELKGVSNFEACKRICDSMGINQIDFNSWFVKMRDTSRELLYPRQGFHWSVYGSLLAADSLVRYMEQLRHIKMPHVVLTNIVHTTQPRFKDDDIAKGLNLVFPVTTETFTYPEIHYTTDTTAVKPNVLYIGDSFLWTWMFDYFMDNTNAHWQVWYYNRILYDKAHRDIDLEYQIPEEERVNELMRADCIVIMYTSRNMSKYTNGFIEQVYNYYYPKN